MLKDAMRRERVNEDEIYSIVLEKGLASVADVGAGVLETDGSLTLVKEVEDLQTATMEQVKRPSGLKG